MIEIMADSVPAGIRQKLETRTLQTSGVLAYRRRGTRPRWFVAETDAGRIYAYLPARAGLYGSYSVCDLRAIPDSPGWRIHGLPDALRQRDVYTDHPPASQLSHRSLIANLLTFHFESTGIPVRGHEVSVAVPLTYPVAAHRDGRRLWVRLRCYVRLHCQRDPYIGASGLTVEMNARDVVFHAGAEPPMGIDWTGIRTPSRYVAPFTIVCRSARPKQFGYSSNRVHVHWQDIVDSAREQCEALTTLMELAI